MATEWDHAIRLRGQTVNGVTTALGSFAAPDESVFLVETRVVARTSSGVSLGLTRAAVFDREGAALALVGQANPVILIANAAIAAAALSIGVSGQSISISATGVDTFTLEWFGLARILILTS